MGIAARPAGVKGEGIAATLGIRDFTAGLLGLIFFFFAAHLAVSWIHVVHGHDDMLGLARFFRLDLEQSLATWYSALALAFSGVLLFAIYRDKFARHDPYSRYWLVLACIFVFLSIDEACSIHENIGFIVRTHVAAFGVASGQWTVVYAALTLALVVVYLPFLRRLWPRPAVAFVAAGAVFVAGAIGLELVQVCYDAAAPDDSMDFPDLVIAGSEELLEMLGILLWIRALLGYILVSNIALEVKLLP